MSHTKNSRKQYGLCLSDTEYASLAPRPGEGPAQVLRRKLGLPKINRGPQTPRKPKPIKPPKVSKAPPADVLAALETLLAHLGGKR